LRPEKIAVSFAFLARLFRSRDVARSTVTAAASPIPSSTPGAYSVTAPIWKADDRCVVSRGSSRDPIAVVKNLDQALTLRDTLDLANGAQPSRRLLDAIYLEEFTPATRDDSN
jgi:hypothetical protein